MRLTKLIASGEAVFSGDDCEISGIAADSRNVKPGYLFVAIPGTSSDGQKFIPEAIKQGAVAILVPEESYSLQDRSYSLPLAGRVGVGGDPQGTKSDLTGDIAPSVTPPLLTSPARGEGHHRPTGKNSSITFVTTPDIRKSISSISAKFYPRQPETIAAITGTSGKTSTAQFTREIWQAMGEKSASIGTLGLITANESRYGSLTTPDAITLHQLLDELGGKNISHLAIEASSHGLAMNRLDNVRIKAAAFTNLSRDHLDFHETMENYLASKLRLFSDVLPEGGAAILNADAPEFEKFSAVARSRNQKILTFGKKGKELRLIESRPDVRGQILRCELFGKAKEIPLPVIGDFQAWNSLCAFGLVVATGGDIEKASDALAKVSGVPGRMQLAGQTKSGGAVFVDYAHKPDALQNVLTAIRPHVSAHRGSKLGVVFGCGGNRDKGKRPIMGDIAARLADWAIVTDDNPRNEDPAAIRKEILAGTPFGKNLREVPDRAKAIEAGIRKLTNSDVLIIAGKGHEPGQIVGDKTLPFDDTQVARRVLGQ